MNPEPLADAGIPERPIAAICPECGIGNLHVTGFHSNSEPPSFELGRHGESAPGRDNPSVTVKCTNPGCPYTDELPGGSQMVGRLYPEPKR